MNILIYVTVLIMTLTIMTYARLENFVDFIRVRKGLSYHMEHVELRYLNKEQEDLYDNKHISTGLASDKNPPELFRGLNIAPLLNPEANSEDIELLSFWLEDLIGVLYGEEPFFKNYVEAENLNSKLLAKSLVSGIRKFILKMDHIISSKDSFYKIDLSSDSKLHEVFASMLKNTKLITNKIETGYYPLTDYLAFKSKSSKSVCVYSASKAVLLVIYEGDYSKVEEIIRYRRALYNEYNRTPKEHRETKKKELGERFKNQYSRGEEMDRHISFELSLSYPKSD